MNIVHYAQCQIVMAIFVYYKQTLKIENKNRALTYLKIRNSSRSFSGRKTQ